VDAQDAPIYDGDAQHPPDDITAALDALGALETELDALGDYDVDALLREYGFEDDNP
jgi:hypothetical protein